MFACDFSSNICNFSHSRSMSASVMKHARELQVLTTGCIEDFYHLMDINN